MGWRDQGALGNDWSMGSVSVAFGEERSTCSVGQLSGWCCVGQMSGWCGVGQMSSWRSVGQRCGVSLGQKRSWCSDCSLSDQRS